MDREIGDEQRGAAELGSGGMTLRGRHFATEELLQIRALVQQSPGEHRYAISKRVCEVLNWRQPNGRLKDRACRDVLLKLHEIGFLRLPPARRPPVKKRRRAVMTEPSAPRASLVVRPRDVDHASFSIVTASGGAQQNRLWNEYVERYHYLGFGVSLGAHIKYWVGLEEEPIACLAFAGAAWRVEARDRWIGWSDAERRRNLCYVVNNTRFLILPWIDGSNLASRLLSVATKRLPSDWQARYGYCPWLLETFVPTGRYLGTCYRAANWIHVGHTKGRGRMDRHFKANAGQKAMFLYPLVKDATRRLRTR